MNDDRHLTDLRYKHRANSDGTFNSICLRCFHTVVTTHDESLLQIFEQPHHCADADLWRSRGLIAIDHRWRDILG
jgi:hypothetical protein